MAESINSNDSILKYKFGVYSKEIRVELPDETIETLFTNIFDKSITTIFVKALYFKLYIYYSIERIFVTVC
jgi:hypothetical protein